LFVQWRGQLAGAPSRLPERAIELFAENPSWTVNKLAARLGVAFTTAQRAIDRLESLGIVALVSDAKRNRVYCARAMIEILEEPAPRDSRFRARGGRKRT
jgi:DNA-binding Lrp family transcriptional regulator